jgi:hypothetical protein
VNVNRVQLLVLGFLTVAWFSLAIILIAAPEVYDASLKLSSRPNFAIDAGFAGAITAFIAMLCIGVVRRWRWTFWLIAVAFLAGALRLPAALLELAGVLVPSGPTWYVVFQAVIGAVQFAIGLAMLRGFRRAGVWGDF